MEFLNSPAGELADYAVAGPGHPAVIAGATRYVRSGGTVVQFTSTPFGVETPLDLSTLYFREVSVVPSYSCGPRDTREAYRLLREGKVDVAPLVTHRFPLEQIQAAYDTAKRGGPVLKVLVTF
jgi:L-iditol 2-dehydrogenase